MPILRAAMHTTVTVRRKHSCYDHRVSWGKSPLAQNLLLSVKNLAACPNVLLFGAWWRTINLNVKGSIQCANFLLPRLWPLFLSAPVSCLAIPPCLKPIQCPMAAIKSPARTSVPTARAFTPPARSQTEAGRKPLFPLTVSLAMILKTTMASWSALDRANRGCAPAPQTRRRSHPIICSMETL